MTKKIVNSYDLFDTLVGRLHGDPQSIFRFVEENYPFPNFKQHRLDAEVNSDGTLDGVYRRMVELGIMNSAEADKVKEFEIQTELEHVFPIPRNIEKVQEGDLIVSDTYYDAKTIRKILDKVGLLKSVEIFVSPAGKASGTIWKNLQDRFEIKTHFGDNQLSDFVLPDRAGIKTILYEGSKYTFPEENAIHFGQVGLANLMRLTRLYNPYPEGAPSYNLWHEQTQLNLPILILACYHLDDFCKNNKIDKLLFTTRDCCHLIKLFKVLFPNYDSQVFLTSRVVYEAPSASYIKYVKELYSENCLVVDLQGSGNSAIRFFREHLNIVPNYFVVVGQAANTDIIHIISSQRKEKIEFLNYDTSGSLIEFNETGPVFLEPEYDLQYILPAHACIQKSFEFLKHYSFSKCDEMLIENLDILDQLNLNIEKYVEHVKFHKKS